MRRVDPKPLVPDKYSRYDSSDLEIEVQASTENIIHLDLP
jgi:hypothetical protein